MTYCLRLSLLLTATAGVGFATAGSAAGQSLRQVIDTEVRAVWQREKITPVPRADDAAFLRRIYLDLLGTIPTYDDAKSFLADGDASKRTKLIDRLLDDPRFALHQRDVWDLVLFGRNPAGYDATRTRLGFKKWLAEQFAKSVPYDRWTRELLLGKQDGTELYHVQYRSQPEEATVAVSRVFLGTQLQCARCHDHPYESWTQRDFYGMAAFFVRLVVLDPSGKKPHRIAEKSTGEVLFTGAVKDQKPGKKGEPVRAKFLGGKLLDEPPVPKDFKEPKQEIDMLVPPLFSRKEKLAEWLTSPDNPYFARAVANRVWAQFLGRGLVHPVDDLSSRNEPSHPALLKALTDHVLAEKFDLKKLIRELVNSDTYQLASTGANTEALPRWFERARVRPLSAEELLAAIPVAAGQPASFKHGGDTIEYFTRYFGEPHDGQGNFQGSLFEHLFMNNADNVRRMLSASKGNLADTLQRMKAPTAEKVDRLFLSVLSRSPSAKERERFVLHLSSDAKMTPALIDEALWALVSCAEFRFNH